MGIHSTMEMQRVKMFFLSFLAMESFSFWFCSFKNQFMVMEGIKDSVGDHDDELLCLLVASKYV